MNYNIFNSDLKSFVENFKFSDKVLNKRFLITGATGLIGSCLCKCLLALDLGIKIFAPVRNLSKARSIYGDNPYIVLHECDLIEYLNNIETPIDYIIHCASPTNGEFISSHPVETYCVTVESTRLLLEYCKKNVDTSMLYVSSIEFYGDVEKNQIVTEDYTGYVDPYSNRSAYPLAKQAAEFICRSYQKEYGVNVFIGRPTQTLGAGVDKSDNRVFSQFARSIINNENIILHTKGLSSKSYCYTIDAIEAFMYIIFKGTSGEAYNISNDESYISIAELALFLKNHFNEKVNVVYNIDIHKAYANTTYLKLSSEKLKALGWSPKYNLYEMFHRLIEYLK